ncbi:MAG: hypothetical protein WBF79_10305 [Rhodococcus sp. (in: high G+C Gram-positive bacteria)]
MRAAVSLLAAAAVGALGALAFAGPRSDTWPFTATVDDLIGWSSTQSTATTAGQALVVVTVALAAAFRLPTRIAPWILAAVFVAVLVFTKVAIPESASLAVFTALHVLKSCAAGLAVGFVLYATRHSRAGWVALASGLLGGTLLASVGTTPATSAFVATRLDSTSVFGEPAWWLIGAAFVLVIAAAVLHRPIGDDPEISGGELARITVYAVIVALVCRLGVEFVGTGEYALWKAITVLVVAVIVVDRVAARWEAADARTVIVAVLATSSAIAVWNAGSRTLIDSRLLTVIGIAGVALGAAVAWRAPMGRILLLVAAVLLAGVPLVVALVDQDVVAAVALGVVAALIPIALTAASPDGPHASVRPLALSLPGLALLFAAAAPVPTGSLAALLSADLGGLEGMDGQATGSISILGNAGEYFRDGTLVERASGDLTSAFLMLGVGVACVLRLAWLSRRPTQPDPVPQ